MILEIVHDEDIAPVHAVFLVGEDKLPSPSDAKGNFKVIVPMDFILFAEGSEF